MKFDLASRRALDREGVWLHRQAPFCVSGSCAVFSFENHATVRRNSFEHAVRTAMHRQATANGYSAHCPRAFLQQPSPNAAFRRDQSVQVWPIPADLD